LRFADEHAAKLPAATPAPVLPVFDPTLFPPASVGPLSGTGEANVGSLPTAVPGSVDPSPVPPGVAGKLPIWLDLAGGSDQEPEVTLDRESEPFGSSDEWAGIAPFAEDLFEKCRLPCADPLSTTLAGSDCAAPESRPSLSPVCSWLGESLEQDLAGNDQVFASFWALQEQREGTGPLLLAGAVGALALEVSPRRQRLALLPTGS
jgi:hypothetical protein